MTHSPKEIYWLSTKTISMEKKKQIRLPKNVLFQVEFFHGLFTFHRISSIYTILLPLKYNLLQFFFHLVFAHFNKFESSPIVYFHSILFIEQLLSFRIKSEHLTYLHSRETKTWLQFVLENFPNPTRMWLFW